MTKGVMCTIIRLSSKSLSYIINVLPKVMGHEEKNAWPCNWKEKEQRASYKTNIHSVIFWLVSLNPTYKLMSWKGQGKAFSEETLFIWVTSVLCGFGFMQLGFTSCNRSLFF